MRGMDTKPPGAGGRPALPTGVRLDAHESVRMTFVMQRRTRYLAHAMTSARPPGARAVSPSDVIRMALAKFLDENNVAVNVP